MVFGFIGICLNDVLRFIVLMKFVGIWIELLLLFEVIRGKMLVVSSVVELLFEFLGVCLRF